MYERIYRGKLYRFLDFNGAEITLKEQKLRLTRPDQLNDPLDCSYYIIKDAVKENIFHALAKAKNISESSEIKEFVEWHLKLVEGNDYLIEETNALNNLIQDFYLTSFSKFYNTEDSFLLWSHYADKHKGICIEFDFTDKLDLFENKEFTPFIPLEINYKRKLEKAKSAGIEILEIMEPWLLQKLSCWSYENELRIIVKKNELIQQRFSHYETTELKKYIKIDIPKSSISKVIFGCKVENPEIDKIKSICAKNEICKNFERMIIDHKTLEFKNEI